MTVHTDIGGTMTDLAIIVRTDANAGDTTHIDPGIDWQAARLDYCARVTEALRTAFPGARVDVQLHALDVQTVHITDHAGPIHDSDTRAQQARWLLADVAQAWIESLPTGIG